MPDRFEDQYQGDSTVLMDGDNSFLALDNRRAPEDLPEGFVQVSNNMRLNQAVAGVRKGLSKQTQSISFSTSLIVPFTVGSGSVLSDGSGIFGATLFSDPTQDNLEYIFLACADNAYLFTPGAAIVTLNYPTNEIVEPTDAVDVFQAGGQVTILRGRLGKRLVLSGITSSTTTATVTTTGAHGLFSNQWVLVAGAVQPAYNGQFQITVTGTTTFTYTMASAPGVTPATGSITVNQVKPPLRWDGVQADALTVLPLGLIGAGNDRIFMPASDFGLLQDARAILEYGRNAVIITDVDNVDSADSLYGVFTFAPGWSDYLIGAHPYQDTQTLIFLRRSIYLINGTPGDVAAMTNQTLTGQVGCISRRSICTCGSAVLFLSDLGVFMLQPGLELQLRGNWEPLSAPITSTIQTINFQAIQQATAVYWNNRYYLAVPTNGSARNNTVLVYNFLNSGWESIDTYPAGFFCDYMVVMNLNNFATLYMINQEGGIYAAEQNELDDYGVSNPPATFLINGTLRTRRMTYDTYNIKQFTRAIVNYALDGNSAFTQTAYTINPSSSKTMPVVSEGMTAGTVTRPFLIKKRGYALELEFSNTAGRGQIVSFSAAGFVTGYKTISSP